MPDQQQQLLVRPSADSAFLIVEAPITGETVKIRLDPAAPDWWKRWRLGRLRRRAARKQARIDALERSAQDLERFGVSKR